MKKSFVTLLILLLTFPCSSAGGGLCPICNAGKTLNSNVSHKKSCCEKHEHASHECAQHKSHAKHAGCHGDCCAGCRLLNSNAQANESVQGISFVHFQTVSIMPDLTVKDFTSILYRPILPATTRYLHLKIPINVPLRI